MAPTREELVECLGKHAHPKALNYGTAGFRADATLLEEAFVRCGIVAACRSHTHGGHAVGAMVTASHNPAQDNGLKLVEPDGSMLSTQWESIVTDFVNATVDPIQALATLVDVCQVVQDKCAVVVVGRDTRESSAALAALLIKGVQATGGKVINVGQVTTPQLHSAVCDVNRHGRCDVQDYYQKLSDALHRLLSTRDSQQPLVDNLIVDCANGIGASAMQCVQHLLPSVSLVNAPGDGPLNEKCGADHVQKRRSLPTVYGAQPPGRLWASLDGDADRLVMYQLQEDGKTITLADGDRFAVLVASFITKHLKAGQVCNLSVAVAQTAYSNGAATDFLNDVDGVQVVVTYTGVKHLEKAVKPYDIGIYWEPNGHGTVLFSPNALETLQAAYDRADVETYGAANKASLDALLAISRLANQAIGDGVADLLLIVGVLWCSGMTFDDWVQLYDERCSCNLAVVGVDKRKLRITDYDRRVEKPEMLRDAIRDITAKEGCRAFVRPSGTEDVIRVYAEAPARCQDTADNMARKIFNAVNEACGGIKQA